MHLIYAYYLLDMLHHMSEFFKNQEEYFPGFLVRAVIYFSLITGGIMTILNIIWNSFENEDNKI